MYLIPIAWLYVAILVAVSEDTVVAGVLTFVFWGIAPLALFMWIFGTPARRRRQREREREALDRNDRAETGPDQ
ncbi:hypothetical protein ACFQ4M_12455 [Thauera mechernichensis]|uniref:Uncharacterized protein n=1 Tax=Thauera mechernichensis TaxID=82788 RepID=A0ABW3WF10_9RHOO|nr:hypothetical protein [Thauera mechernichensis]MDG3063822.1 hypothetical protein [Thauera mechernichensis]